MYIQKWGAKYHQLINYKLCFHIQLKSLIIKQKYI